MEFHVVECCGYDFSMNRIKLCPIIVSVMLSALMNFKVEGSICGLAPCRQNCADIFIPIIIKLYTIIEQGDVISPNEFQGQRRHLWAKVRNCVHVLIPLTRDSNIQTKAPQSGIWPRNVTWTYLRRAKNTKSLRWPGLGGSVKWYGVNPRYECEISKSELSSANTISVGPNCEED